MNSLFCFFLHMISTGSGFPGDVPISLTFAYSWLCRVFMCAQGSYTSENTRVIQCMDCHCKICFLTGALVKHRGLSEKGLNWSKKNKSSFSSSEHEWAIVSSVLGPCKCDDQPETKLEKNMGCDETYRPCCSGNSKRWERALCRGVLCIKRWGLVASRREMCWARLHWHAT